MDYINNDFDELEPRATPQPTVLKCITDPSVPEVSLIFGKQSPTPQVLSKNRVLPSEKCKAYINWKSSGYPSPPDPRLASQKFKPNSGCDRTLSSPAVTYSASSVFPKNAAPNYTPQPLSNSFPMHYNLNQSVVPQKNGSTAPAGNAASNGRQESHRRSSHDDISAYAAPRTELTKTPMQNGSYNAIKSILKSSLSNPATKSNSDNFVDRDFHSKSPSRSSRDSPRQTDISLYSRSSPVARCQHSNEISSERDTVRDLLLLVKNQNEQIKTLQSQVERLLEIHENNVVENCRSIATRTSSKCQSPTNSHEIEAPMKSNVVVAAQKTCRSRGINVLSCFPGDEQLDVPLRFQNEPLRNTIVEKKVSIGVMTSFEFSVQNNPFVTEPDNQTNGGHRDCDKNLRSNDARAKSHCSRKIPPGPLENINEDTESHPSSIGRASSNDTQMSSPEKFPPQRATNANSNFVGSCSNSNGDKNSSIMFSSKPVAYSSEMYENIRSQNNEVSENPNNQAQRTRNFGERSPNKLKERQVASRRDEANEFEEKRDTDSRNERIDRRFCGISKYDSRSMPTENTAEGSLILCSSDLEVQDRSPPSLDPSIHVEMREYSSEDESEGTKRAPAVGWTFYKNVVGQVNRILHTIPNGQDINDRENIKLRSFPNENIEKKDILSSVKNATMEQLKMLGISYAEHSQFNSEHTQKKVTFDSSYIPTVDCQMNVTQPSNSMTETNTSMHMKALALKYLSDEQLADLAVHQQGVGATMKHKFLSVQGTNMSFATMNYLQRYCLVSGMHTLNPEGNGHGNAMNQKKVKPLVTPKEPVVQPLVRNHSFENSLHRTVSDNILDMTTLKQQPKLL